MAYKILSTETPFWMDSQAMQIFGRLERKRAGGSDSWT